ncbi:MAG: NUDIX domain-containing protein [Bacteroidales bacterium]
MICIYVNTNKIYLSSKHSFEADKNTINSTIHTINSEEKLKKISAQFLNHAGNFESIVLQGDIEYLKRYFFRIYPKIEAAGGAVFNEYDELLMILRKGKWDLPKGKKEEGETPELSAIREVMEETGIDQPEVKSQLPCTYHMYVLNGQWVVKQTRWFLMHAQKQPLVPQTIESITMARWVPHNEILLKAGQSFESLKPVIRSAIEY